MSENVYLIQFCYNGTEHTIHPLSYHDYSKANLGDVLTFAQLIEDHIKENNLHVDGAKVSNAHLFGKEGELIVKVDDFSKL